MQFDLTVRMLSAGLVLASCGGGGSGGGGGGGTFVFPTEYNARLDASHQLNDQANAAAVTADAAMPQNGSATYQGYAALGGADGAGDPVDLLGNAHLDADFAAGTVDGTIDGFQGFHGTNAVGAYSGSVAVSAGDIGVVTGSDMTANLNGSLTRDGDTLALNGDLVGDFHGNAAEYLLLVLNGQVRTNGGPSGSLGGTISTIKP